MQPVKRQKQIPPPRTQRTRRILGLTDNGAAALDLRGIEGEKVHQACLLLLVLFRPAGPTVDRSRWRGRDIGLVFGDEMATGEAEVHECAIRGHTDDFAH